MRNSTAAGYEFGPFRIDMERYLLLREEETIPLSPKVFETLLYLVQHAGQIAKKEDILNSVWPDTFVEESNLAQNIFLLRKALGEEKNQHRYIVTLPGIGYRFVAPVSECGATTRTTKLEKNRAVESIAVLPFKNLAGDENDRFLGLGLTDALITRLSSMRHVRVRPTAAVLRYALEQQDPLVIGRELNVDALLHGVYQQEADKIRVSVQLVSVNDGITVWAAMFDQRMTDIFAIQDSISDQVVRSLALQISGDEQRQMQQNYTQNPEAFQLFFKGRYFWNQRTSEGLKKALEYAQQAIAADPTYALAYIGLADSYSLLGAQHNVLAPMESFPKARAAAQRALEIDGMLAEAYTSLGFVECCFDWDWSAAERSYLKAIDLKPNYPTAHHWYGELLNTMGRFAEAEVELQRAQEFDPLSLAINVDIAASFYYARQYERSERQLIDLLELNPNFTRAHLVLGRVYERQGVHDRALDVLTKAVGLSDDDPVTRAALALALASAGSLGEARKILFDLERLSERRYVSACRIAEVYLGLGEPEMAYQWLDRGFANRDVEFVWIRVNPVFDPLRDQKRFNDLVCNVSPLLL